MLSFHVIFLEMSFDAGDWEIADVITIIKFIHSLGLLYGSALSVSGITTEPSDADRRFSCWVN